VAREVAVMTVFVAVGEDCSHLDLGYDHRLSSKNRHTENLHNTTNDHVRVCRENVNTAIALPIS